MFLLLCNNNNDDDDDGLILRFNHLTRLDWYYARGLQCRVYYLFH